MFGNHTRRSGSKRCVWHRRGRERRPKSATPRSSPSPAAVLPPAQTYTLNGWITPTRDHWRSGDPVAVLRCLVHLATDRRLAPPLAPQQIERKLRLFYCACARLRLASRRDAEMETAVRVVEKYADGAAHRLELAAACGRQRCPCSPAGRRGDSTPPRPRSAAETRPAWSAPPPRRTGSCGTAACGAGDTAVGNGLSGRRRVAETGRTTADKRLSPSRRGPKRDGRARSDLGRRLPGVGLYGLSDITASGIFRCSSAS